MDKKVDKSWKYLLLKGARIATFIIGGVYIFLLVQTKGDINNVTVVLTLVLLVLFALIQESKQEKALRKQYDLLFKVIDKQLPGVVLNQNFSSLMSENNKQALVRKVKSSCWKYLRERKKYYISLIIDTPTKDRNIEDYYADKLKEDYEMYLYQLMKNLGML